MNVHVYVTNRPASGVPYQAGPMLTSIPSTSSAVYPSAVAGHSENLICATAGKVNSNSCFDICYDCEGMKYGGKKGQTNVN